MLRGRPTAPSERSQTEVADRLVGIGLSRFYRQGAPRPLSDFAAIDEIEESLTAHSPAPAGRESLGRVPSVSYRDAAVAPRRNAFVDCDRHDRCVVAAP